MAFKFTILHLQATDDFLLLSEYVKELLSIGVHLVISATQIWKFTLKLKHVL